MLITEIIFSHSQNTLITALNIVVILLLGALLALKEFSRAWGYPRLSAWSPALNIAISALLPLVAFIFVLRFFELLRLR